MRAGREGQSCRTAHIVGVFGAAGVLPRFVVGVPAVAHDAGLAFRVGVTDRGGAADFGAKAVRPSGVFGPPRASEDAEATVAGMRGHGVFSGRRSRAHIWPVAAFWRFGVLWPASGQMPVSGLVWRKQGLLEASGYLADA